MDVDFRDELLLDFFDPVFFAPDFFEEADFFADDFLLDVFVLVPDFFEAAFLEVVFFDDVFLLADFFDASLFFDGNLAPFALASLKPIAIACLRLVTFLPDRPLSSVLSLRRCIASPTEFCAFFEYLAIVICFAMPEKQRALTCLMHRLLTKCLHQAGLKTARKAT